MCVHTVYYIHVRYVKYSHLVIIYHLLYYFVHAFFSKVLYNSTVFKDHNVPAPLVLEKKKKKKKKSQKRLIQCTQCQFKLQISGALLCYLCQQDYFFWFGLFVV